MSSYLIPFQPAAYRTGQRVNHKEESGPRVGLLATEPRGKPQWVVAIPPHPGATPIAFPIVPMTFRNQSFRGPEGQQLYVVG